MDPMVKQVLALRMTRAVAAAKAPRRSLGFQIGLAGAAAALVGILMFAVFLRRNDGPSNILGPGQAAVQNPESPSANDGKADPVAPDARAKPDAPDPKSPGIKPGPEPAIAVNAPAFLVTDPAGYSKSLEDYRERVLLVGVWSADQPEAAQNIQKLYQSFGNRKEVRILGVTSRNQERPAGMTFPLVFNSGSRLLDTRTSDYVIVGKDGTVQMRGSLIGDSNALTAKIKSKLDELGGK